MDASELDGVWSGYPGATQTIEPMTFAVAKRFKRIVVIDVLTGEVIYCPPNFITLNSRDDLKPLVHAFNFEGQRDIQAIIQFEARLHPDKKFRP